MKIQHKKNILMLAAAVITVITLLSMKSSSMATVGQGTLFTLSGNPLSCHPVDCARKPNGIFCALQTYYTHINCSDVGSKFQPRTVAA